MSVSCDLNGPQARAARREYQALHEGLPAARVRCEDVPAVPPEHELVWLGKLTVIQYRKEVLDPTHADGTASYKHPYRALSQGQKPDLYVWPKNGHLYTRGAHYTVTSHGIEDRPSWSASGRKAPLSSPARMITLGKLEWLRYNDGRRTRILAFPVGVAPLVAHDESRKLHFLGGGYRVPAPVGGPGPRPNPHRTTAAEVNPMARRSRRSKKKMVRANPAAAMRSGGARGLASASMRLAFSTAAASAVGLGTIAALEKGLEGRIVNPTYRAIAKASIGLVGAIGAYAALPQYPQIAAGIGFGGMIDGMKDGVAIIRARSAASAPAAQLGAATTPAATTPATGRVAYVRR